MSGGSLTCREVHRLIVERLDRTLSADDEYCVDQHISTCADCLVFYEQMAVIRKACQALKEGKAVWDDAKPDSNHSK